MPYHVVKRGSQYCVEKKDDRKSFGCHPTRRSADQQLAALYANEPKAAIGNGNNQYTMSGDRGDATVSKTRDGEHRVSFVGHDGTTSTTVHSSDAEARMQAARKVGNFVTAMRHAAATSTASGYKPRREVFEGRPHLAVPVVMLVEGVVHAVNAETPELVTLAEFGKQPAGWDGRPLYHGHPMRNGKPVSGNAPEVLAKERIGMVQSATLKDGKLVSEAWIDEALARERAPELLKRAEAGDPIEISVGAFVETDDVTGDYNGRSYKAAWRNIVPDHLALLPTGDEGACSMEMGCGVRAAIGNGSNQYVSKSSDAHAAAAAAHRKAADIHTAAAEATGNHATNSRKALNASRKAEVASKAAEKTPHNAAGRAVDAAEKADDANHGHSTSDPIEQHSEAAAAHIEAAKYHEYQAQYERGPRGASAHESEVSMEHMYAAWLEDDAPISLLRSLRNIPQSERDQMDKSDFAGPNESFPIKEPVDVNNAARAIGRAKGDRGAIKSKIISIAYRKGDAFVAQLPDDWKHKSDQKNASRFVKIMEAARNFFRVSQSPDEMSDADLRAKLFAKLCEVEDRVLGVEAFYPINDPAHVVYRVWDLNDGDEGAMAYGPSTCLYERPFTMDKASGVVTLGDAKVEVQPVTSYEPVDGAKAESDLKAASSAEKPAVQDPATGAPAAESTNKTPCGCGGSDNSAGDSNMTKAERIAALKACEHNPIKDASILESLSDEQLSVLEAEGKIRTALGIKNDGLRACGTKADAEAVIKKMADAHQELHGYAAGMAAKAAKKDGTQDPQAPSGGNDKTETNSGSQRAAVASAPTFEELLAKANPDVRAAIKAGEDSAKAKRAATIKTLKDSGRNLFSDSDLESFSQEQLDRLVALADVKVVDYSGAGAPRSASSNPTAAPAAPDLGEALRAARKR